MKKKTKRCVFDFAVITVFGLIAVALLAVENLNDSVRIVGAIACAVAICGTSLNRERPRPEDYGLNVEELADGVSHVTDKE